LRLSRESRHRPGTSVGAGQLRDPRRVPPPSSLRLRTRSLPPPASACVDYRSIQRSLGTRESAPPFDRRQVSRCYALMVHNKGCFYANRHSGVVAPYIRRLRTDEQQRHFLPRRFAAERFSALRARNRRGCVTLVSHAP
jgi:hypothetical protein